MQHSGVFCYKCFKVVLRKSHLAEVAELAELEQGCCVENGLHKALVCNMYQNFVDQVHDLPVRVPCQHQEWTTAQSFEEFC